ncbi:MAG: hypothetical protein B7Y51_04720 [Burkholderiales bacterium 28-67-8]|nr:MAG: hypothetical protein B7Y51_04720 [Burkholderiales bacterium 28-67-8]
MDAHAVSLPGGLAVRHLVWRVLLATSVVLLTSHGYARDVVTRLMPVLSWGLATVANDFKVLSFELMTDRGQTTIGAVVRLERSLVFGSQVVVPDGASTMVVGAAIGNVLQPLLVALVWMLAWPGGWFEMALRLLLGTGLQAGVLLLNVPCSMAAWLWLVQLKRYAPDTVSPLVWWNVFLQGGGRLVLGLLCAALAIALAKRLSGRPGRATDRVDVPTSPLVSLP